MKTREEIETQRLIARARSKCRNKDEAGIALIVDSVLGWVLDADDERAALFAKCVVRGQAIADQVDADIRDESKRQ